MPTIHRYRPAYFSGFPDEASDFYTKEQLLNIKWVNDFTINYSGEKQDEFHQFSLSINGDSIMLMAEFDNGNKWWVVGMIPNISNDKDIAPMELLKELPMFKK